MRETIRLRRMEMKSPWETTLFKMVLQPAVSVPSSYHWSLCWNQSLRCSKLQLQNRNDKCYPGITQSGELVWAVLSWGVEKENQESWKADCMEGALLSQDSIRNAHTDPVQGWKFTYSICLILCPSCLQEQAGTRYYREGKTKMGGSIALPVPRSMLA